MCGILTQFEKQQALNDRNIKLFLESLKLLKHRGPDATDYVISSNETYALGHTRLALTGRENGRQPISNETGEIYAVVNGEFYQYETIRTNLEQQGHRFKTDSDSEILVHLYEQYGMQFTDYLNGEFAFVLADHRAAEPVFIAGRDRFGVKPLHYTDSSKHLVIASEAKAILPIAPDCRKWDTEALHQTFTHQYLSTSKSIFSGVKQLPPAHLLVHAEGKTELLAYWDFPTDQTMASRAVEPDELLHDLRRNVSDRLHQDAAFSLSSGVDSSSIVALASEIRSENVPCFSISFDSDDYNEASIIRSTASQIGADLNIVPVSRNDLLEHLPTALYYSEGFAINGQLVGKYLMNKEVHRAGHKVILSGEGADEAFLGYAHLEADFQDQSLDAIGSHPLQAGLMLADSEFSISNELPSWMNAWPSFLLAKMSFCGQLRGLLKAEFLREYSAQTLDNTLTEFRRYNPYSNKKPVLNSAHLWSRTALANYILHTLGDGTEMPHSIEGRVPFLDHHLVEKAWAIPTQQKLNSKHSKAIFRDAVSNILPEEIAYRPKHPLIAPPILTDPALHCHTRDLIHSSMMSDVMFIDQKKLSHWFKTMSQASENHQQSADPILMTILSSMHLQHQFKLSL